MVPALSEPKLAVMVVEFVKDTRPKWVEDTVPLAFKPMYRSSAFAVLTAVIVAVTVVLDPFPVIMPRWIDLMRAPPPTN